jgi:glutamine synthetase adenylyltransferase
MAASSQPELLDLPSSVQFRNPDSARRSLAHIAQLAPSGVLESLLAFLPAAAEPDAAVAQFERLAERASAVLWERFRTSAFLVHYALLLFGCSEWIGETLIRNQELFGEFVAQRTLFERPRSHEYFQARLPQAPDGSGQSDFATLLAGFKRREYAGIVLRDLLGLITVSQLWRWTPVCVPTGARANWSPLRLSSGRISLAKREHGKP